MTRHDSEPADATAGGWSAYAPLSGATFVPSSGERASPEAVAAARSRPDHGAAGPIPVRLMNEYSVAWPLWNLDGFAEEGTLPVSPALAARLRAWAAFFEDHFHWETGWDGAGRGAPHAAEGRELRRLLVDELGPGYDVTLSLWETGTDTA